MTTAYASRMIEPDRVQHTAWTRDGRPLSYRDAIAALADDAAFRTSMIAVLAATPFAAYRWETPAVTTATLDRAFEFVCVPSPGLAGPADRAPFASHVTDTDADVVAFRNLGGDAVLVVPCPRAADDVYAHLGAFIRGAPAAQHHALWREVGVQMAARVGAKPVWLSTAGAGVAWLHVRLDDRPKYYSHRPYALG